MRDRYSIIKEIDWLLIGLYVLLVSLGLSNIYSAVYDADHPFIFDLDKEYGKQLMWIGVSVFIGLMILLLDGSFIKKNAYWVYGVTMLLLLLVLFTSPINGARSWFGFGSVGIQPSEFAKIGISLALAKYVSELGSSFSELKSKLRIAIIIGIPAVLVLLQPDAGTFIIFVSFVLMLYREGLSGNIILFGIVAIVVAIITLTVADDTFFIPFTKIKMSGKFGVFLFIVFLSGIFAIMVRNFVLPRNRKVLYRAIIGGFSISIVFVHYVEVGYRELLQKHQRDRIDLLLEKTVDPDGKGYNINRSKAAIGSGGFLGKGYMNSKLANANQRHVPMQSTDFIFCTWSEERGFLGSTFLIILYLGLLLKIITVAERQRSRFTRIYGYCVAGIFFFHVLINIGMAVGLAPVIGIPLPFFSYGGSSMMAFSILLFTLIKLDSERKNVLQ
ncbi:MAG: rod shape-determining protein RodA [Putridiphycobacter sp.]|nr:rod shape-determining protein RodA [Putridiphycobacter sp.]